MNINTEVFHRSLHLDDSRLEPPDSSCPFCSSTNRQYILTLQENPEVLLLQCDACHAASASRMPTDKALMEYYSSYYDFSTSRASDGQITFDDPLRLARNLTNIYRRYQGDATVSILDFGGGDGTISHLVAMQLIKRGAAQVNITVVDFTETTVCPQDSRISIDKADFLGDVVSVYGIVLASAVIEHYPYPRALLQDLLRCMDQGGLFYARTPCMSSIIKLLQLIGIKADFTYPGHLHDLGQTFWEGYFSKEQSSFQILESRPSIVETTLRKHFLNTVAAYSFKAPWYLFGESYKYVGGWEVFVRKNSSSGIRGRR